MNIKEIIYNKVEEYVEKRRDNICDNYEFFMFFEGFFFDVIVE